jgi:SlyX protein
MNDAHAVTERIEKLEARIAHQDRILEDLNTTVTDQWKQIEALTKQIARMGDRLQSVEESVPALPSGSEKPPHY